MAVPIILAVLEYRDCDLINVLALYHCRTRVRVAAGTVRGSPMVKTIESSFEDVLSSLNDDLAAE